eukprot:2489570-Pyramimonas_sp.AAC.1
MGPPESTGWPRAGPRGDPPPAPRPQPPPAFALSSSPSRRVSPVSSAPPAMPWPPTPSNKREEHL